MEWGWTPTTVEAIATVLATVLSSTAALIAVIDLRRRRAADRRTQAGLIAAWTTIDEAGTVEGFQLYGCNLHVANRSDLPVMALVVAADPAPSLGDDREPSQAFWHTLGPAQTDIWTLGTTDGHDRLGYPGRVRSVEFTDHAGVRWRRDDAGLAEVASNAHG